MAVEIHSQTSKSLLSKNAKIQRKTASIKMFSNIYIKKTKIIISLLFQCKVYVPVLIIKDKPKIYLHAPSS